MPYFKIQPDADTDLTSQTRYLTREGGLTLGKRFSRAVMTTFERLAEMPNMGRRYNSDKELFGERARVAC